MPSSTAPTTWEETVADARRLGAEEVWLSANPEYEVSSFGNVRRVGKEKPLSVDSRGMVRLRCGGYVCHRRVWHMVVSVFYGGKARYVRHRDGNPENNSVLNLVVERI